jgi:heme exporter protein D
VKTYSAWAIGFFMGWGGMCAYVGEWLAVGVSAANIVGWAVVAVCVWGRE